MAELPAVADDNIPSPIFNETKREWLEIYRRFSRDALDESQIAEEYGLSPVQVHRVIQWATKQLHGRTTVAETKGTVVDRIRARIRALENIKVEAKSVTEKVLIAKEQRLHDRMLSQIQGVMEGDDKGKGPVQVNVQINNVKRPKGAVGGKRKGKVREVKAEAVDE